MMLSSMITYSFAQKSDMQDGYDYQANKINLYLEDHTDKLNNLFDFNKIGINGKLNPAWLCEKKSPLPDSKLIEDKFCVNDKKYPIVNLYKDEITKEQIT